ncbi:MAG: tetratricopeptide repeat protein [Bacteroidetes bacterium]|nr:tetratricopeptide repeat protein [Bacteroidota bacterium]
MIRSRTYFSPLLCFCIASVFFFSSCSTKKNTWTRRVYHDLTAHYNVYWNGMDQMRQGLKEFESNTKDNYALVLPVYYFGDKTTNSKITQSADIAIKKCTKTIQKHSMFFNNKEYNHWVDDAYMLIGKSYFYKQDFPMARRTFEFVIKTFNDNPVKYEAMMWQALSNMQLGDFNRAEPMLDMVQNMIKQGKAPEKYEEMMALTYANFYILQKNYPPAIEFLDRALEIGPKRYMKTRCLFILGQIYQKTGQLDVASNYYKMVIKRNASFEMEFNSKINLALCYMGQSGNRDYIVKKLKKMLKDEKNKDYCDQIYYALARVALKDADTAAATAYLTKSVASSKQNNYQKAISALDLADILFAHKNYKLAQAYYDSTLQFLPKDFPNYKELSKKTSTLTDLVSYLTLIEREDSLQRLAGMPEGKRNSVIDGIIAKLIEEEIKKQKEEQERQENLALFGQSKGQTPGGPGSPQSGASAGSWYFYNAAAMSNGFSTFARKWGRRKLEDNWFLANKAIVAEVPETTEGDTSTMASPGDTTKGKKAGPKSRNPKERGFYMQDIPLTPAMMKLSNDTIIQAYYNLGFVYVEGLNDYEHAIDAFQTLNTRFPENKYMVPSYYELYILYKTLENQPESNNYKNIILTRYPETDFAKLLVNPDYYKEAQSKRKEVMSLYDDTYKAFTNQQYYMVINNADVALAKYPGDTALIPRFEYLKALSIGKIEVVDSLVTGMQRIIAKYPKSPVKPLAQKVLDYLNNQRNSKGEKIVTDSTVLPEPVTKLYSFNPNSIHFFVLIADNNRTDINALKIKIADFNQKYFSVDNLQVNSLLLDGNQEMITVNNFESDLKAMNYYLAIQNNPYVFTKLETTGGYSDFVISSDNYPIFYRSKDIKLYQKFFEKNYPIKK